MKRKRKGREKRLHDPTVIRKIVEAANSREAAASMLFDLDGKLNNVQREEAERWRRETMAALETRCRDQNFTVEDLLNGYAQLPLSDDERIYKSGWLQQRARSKAVKVDEPSKRFEGESPGRAW